MATEARGDRRTWQWFWLSLILPTYYGVVSLIYSFSQPFVVQDDVRQHGFWMARFLDPSLFPNDLIATYFQSVAPLGYRSIYALFAQGGIDPLFVAKLLPLPLGLIAAGYGYWLALTIFPLPVGAFACSTILTQSLWLQDDLITGVARSFIYPLFLAFLYYLVRRSLLPCLITAVLQVLIYPQVGLVQIGIVVVRSLSLENWKLRWGDRRDWMLALIVGGIALAALLLLLPNVGELGPPVTAAQMRTMPEYAPTGRAKFFHPDPFTYWWSGDSGLSFPADPPWIWLGALLPLVLMRRSLLPVPLSAQARILVDILVSSLGLFAIAHLLLFRLHFPNRYTQHGLRVVMAIAAGIVVTTLVHWLWRWLQRPSKASRKGRGAVTATEPLQPKSEVRGRREILVRSQLLRGLLGFVLAAALIIPAHPSVFLPLHNQVVGQYPDLYRFIASKPKDVLIASLAEEASNLPSFSRRSILTSREYALPYHVGYYNQIRQRSLDLIRAHYTSDLGELQALIQQYGIDYFLVERAAFRPEYIADSDWMMQYQPAAHEAIARLNQNEVPLLAKLADSCSPFQDKNLRVIDAACIAGLSLP